MDGKPVNGKLPNPGIPNFLIEIQKILADNGLQGIVAIGREAMDDPKHTEVYAYCDIDEKKQGPLMEILLKTLAGKPPMFMALGRIFTAAAGSNLQAALNAQHAAGEATVKTNRPGLWKPGDNLKPPPTLGN